MNLLIDIGNSNTHFAVHNGKNIIIRKKCSTYSKKDISDKLKYFNSTVNITNVGISSVVPKTKLFISGNITKLFKLKPLIINYKTKLPVRIKLKFPETVGADRICNAVYGYSKSSKKNNVLVIDLGTANTYDLILKNGDFIGGIIAPGLMTSSTALNLKTAALPLIKFNSLTGKTPLIGRKTIDAIRSGLINYMKFATEGIIHAVKKKYPDKLEVILTGGSAIFFKNNTNFKHNIIENTVLEGINLILNFNSGKFRN